MITIKLQPYMHALLAAGLLSAGSMALAQRPSGQSEAPPPPQQDTSAREREAARQREEAAARERAAAAQSEREAAARAEAARTSAARAEASREAAARQGGADRSRSELGPRERDQVIEQMITAERKHRELQGRISRLAALFREQGDARQLEELEALRQKSEKRYRAAFAGFKEKLGPDTSARVEAAMYDKAGRTSERRIEAGAREATPSRTEPARERSDAARDPNQRGGG